MSNTKYITELIKRLEPQGPPSMLYHYTSAAGLLGILESKSIWSTSIRYLNDSQEYELALELAQEVLESLKSAADSEFKVGLYEVMSQSLQDVHGTEIFVSSFSEHGDQLSQWRGYCPAASGYAIGFDLGSLIEPTHEYETGFLAPCVYDTGNQGELIESLVNDVTRFAHDFESDQKRSRTWEWWDEDRDQLFRQERDRTYREAYKLFSKLLPALGPVIKHNTFSEESEWRLISQATNEREFEPELRPGHAMLIPYIRRPLYLQEKRLVFTEIIVGPTPHSDLALHAVETLLQKCDVGALSIRKSEIPYRDW